MSIDTATESWKPADTLANRILLVRNTTGMSQREFAMRAGVTFGVIQGIEKGRSPREAVDVIRRIAREFRVDRDWLMWGGPLNEESPAGDDPTGQSMPATGSGPGCAPRDSNPEPIDSGSNVIPLFGAVAA